MNSRIGRGRKRSISSMEELPSCSVPIKTYTRKKLVDPLACSTNEQQGCVTINRIRAALDLNTEEMNQDIGPEVQYILPQSPSNVYNNTLVNRGIIPYVNLENGDKLLETLGQGSDQHFPLLDPTVLESRALDPKFTQVKNLMQNKEDDLEFPSTEEGPSLFLHNNSSHLSSDSNVPLWKTIHQPDTVHENGKPKSMDLHNPLLNQENQKLDKAISFTSMTCTTVPSRPGLVTFPTMEKPEAPKSAKELKSPSTLAVVKPSQSVTAKIIETMRPPQRIETSRSLIPVATCSTEVTCVSAQMKNHSIVVSKDSGQNSEHTSPMFIPSRVRTRRNGAKPNQLINNTLPTSSLFANGKTIVTYSVNKKARVPQATTTSNTESPRESTDSSILSTTKCTVCCEKDFIIAQLNAKLKFYEEISRLEQYSAGLRSISSSVEQISKNLEPLKRISSRIESPTESVISWDQAQREPIVELIVHDTVVKEEPYDESFICYSENPLFPITEELISRIPSTFRVDVPTFVTKLLSMLYEPDYFNTHKLPGQVNVSQDRIGMNEFELQNIIETVMNCKLGPSSRVKPIAESDVRNAIARMFVIGSK